MTAAAIRRLTLTNFRSYHAAGLDIGKSLVVLTGPNGAGKTNLIEAISFLVPGRGLRRAALEEVAFSEGDGSWAASAEVEGMLGLATLGTGIEPPAADATGRTRLCRIDREPVGSAAAFADHLRVVWLTPAMDQLFAGPASERRRFLDRLVLAVDAEHQGRVNALERALRSRNRLLEDPRPDPHWLDAIEHETAELAVAVAAQRAETVHRLQGALASRKDDAFPSAEITLDGWMEQLLPEHPAVEIEERYRGILKDNRPRDAAAGRTLDGPHLTDFKVTHAGKGIPAAEGAADRARAGACGAAQRDDRLRAGAAARRGGGASRSRPPHGALRRAWPFGRAGFHDRRRSGSLRGRGLASRCVHCESRPGRAPRLVSVDEFPLGEVPGTSPVSGI